MTLMLTQLVLLSVIAPMILQSSVGRAGDNMLALVAPGACATYLVVYLAYSANYQGAVVCALTYAVAVAFAAWGIKRRMSASGKMNYMAFVNAIAIGLVWGLVVIVLLRWKPW